MIKKVGDWEKVGHLIKNLRKEWEASKNMALKMWALKAEAIAKKHISAQDLGWTSLKAATVARKVREGYSENILVQSSDYFQAITSWTDFSSGVAYAGVKKAVRNSEGEEIDMIAKVLEFGSISGSTPPRPLWQPTYEEMTKWIGSGEGAPDRIFMKKMEKYLR